MYKRQPLKVSSRPAASTADTKVLNDPAPTAVSTMSPFAAASADVASAVVSSIDVLAIEVLASDDAMDDEVASVVVSPSAHAAVRRARLIAPDTARMRFILKPFPIRRSMYTSNPNGAYGLVNNKIGVISNCE